ncbi:uncharacterized protein LOC144353814 [Saccoglossus kowalevskii]
MAGKFFEGIGQSFVGGVACIATLGLCDDVNRWTEAGAEKIHANAVKAWGADGEITKFAESIPGVGYIASAGHGIAAAVTGDEKDLQRARRACAASTKSSLVTAGAIGGTLLGGPAGAVAGAALGSTAGQCSEKGINHANDKEFQTSGGTYHDFHAGNFIAEIAIDGALGGICAGTTATAGKTAARKAVGESMKEVGGGGVKRYATKRAVEQVIAKPVTGVSGAAIKAVHDPRKSE